MLEVDDKAPFTRSTALLQMPCFPLAVSPGASGTSSSGTSSWFEPVPAAVRR